MSVSSEQKHGLTVLLASQRSTTAEIPTSRVQGGEGIPIAIQMFPLRATNSLRVAPLPGTLGDGAEPHGALRPVDNPLDRVDPVSDPTPVTSSASDVSDVSPGIPPSVAGDAAAQAKSPDPAIPGERLGVPYGVQPAWPDYGRPTPSYAFLAML